MCSSLTYNVLILQYNKPCATMVITIIGLHKLFTPLLTVKFKHSQFAVNTLSLNCVTVTKCIL